MIDLHCHLCFGVDDGPKDAKESVDLAKALVDVDVTEVTCTPHIRTGKGWENTIAVQAKLHGDLDVVLRAAHVELLRHQGAEHYIDEKLFEVPFRDRVVPYGKTRYLLVELPYQSAPPNLFSLLFELQKGGYRIVLAHVERYPYIVDNQENVDRLVNGGFLIQVNLGSLSGVYGRDHQKAAERLITTGVASIAAGDCHHANDVKPNIVKGRKALQKLVGDAGVRLLTEERPRLILDDQPPERVWP